MGVPPAIPTCLEKQGSHDPIVLQKMSTGKIISRIKGNNRNTPFLYDFIEYTLHMHAHSLMLFVLDPGSLTIRKILLILYVADRDIRGLGIPSSLETCCDCLAHSHHTYTHLIMEC